PTQASDTLLQLGRWTGDGACLSVAESGCNLTVGCGHGQFARPTLRADGSFEIDGTYRIEVAPVGTTPAPPARFIGLATSFSVTIARSPTARGMPPGTYTTSPPPTGPCSLPCV